MKVYYQKHYGQGFDYAYTYPAMTKVIQAAGRVIRSPTDRGLIVLIDNRFIDATYTKCMPEDWFDTHPQEIISSSILKDISQFWAKS